MIIINDFIILLMETPYKKKLKEYNDTISKKKSDLATIQSEIIQKTIKKEPPIQGGNSGPSASESQAKNQAKKAEEFMKNTSILKDILEEKGKFIEIQYEKERLIFENEKNKLNKRIEVLQKNEEQNLKRIAEQTAAIAAHKMQIKLLNQKIDQKTQTLDVTQKQNAQYREENTAIKLQNKSLLTENKLLAKCCDRLQKGKEEEKLKNQAQMFEEKQKKIIESLYGKTTIESKSEIELQNRYHHHDLSNKLKYDELMEEYSSFRSSTLLKLEQQAKDLDEKNRKISKMNQEIDELRKIKKNLQEIRQTEKIMMKQKDDYLLKSEEKHNQTQAYAKFLKLELDEKNYVPIIKQKVGSIYKIKKVYY